jgi:hypothetical protein
MPTPWVKAIGTMALLCSAMLAAHPAAAETAPVKLAVFEFELEDFTAAVATPELVAADAGHLADTTAAVRDALAKSGRYEIVDVSAAEDPEVAERALRDCNGCDAAIAQRLGAAQSLVGVVRRISRTEYIVRYQLRDAATGTVLSAADTGLRMGADYSWSRGALRLVKDRLLASEVQQ